MRRIVVLALVAVLALGVFGFAQVGSSPDNPIYMLLVPSTEGATVEAVGKAIAEDIHNKTGLYIVASLQADYTAMIEAFAASEGDTCGFPTTDQYIRIYERTGGNVSPRLASMRYGNDYYFASVYARRDSGIETLEDMNGKTWIYNETGSTSGYVLPHDVFKANGITVGGIVESGGHTNSMVALIEGQGDFCTGYGSPPLPPAEGFWAGWQWRYGMDPELWIWGKANNALYSDKKDRGMCVDLRRAMRKIYDLETVLTDIGVVMTMGPVPNDCLCFGPDFPTDIADTIVATIQDQFKDEAMKALWNDPNFYEWTAVNEITDSYYDSYRDLLGIEK
ncbi:TPA: hypothetical protein DIT45_00410 [Candidatus Acetothermia bacterium]|nr:hypothetical protein [Candidatus Acetothermia bacterium]